MSNSAKLPSQEYHVIKAFMIAKKLFYNLWVQAQL